MDFPLNYYKATNEFNDFGKHINAPYIRKSFQKEKNTHAEFLIGATGFYRAFVNGKEITKGLLAPYINNPNHLVYFDKYDISDYLLEGENVIGIILGNGMKNCPGGRVWDFDIARFRGAPSFTCRITLRDEDGNETVTEADESFLTAPSPILFDDIRMGCFYDANLEIKGWNKPGFDDSEWKQVIRDTAPGGDCRICEADPIRITEEISPVKISETVFSEDFDNRSNMRLKTQFDFAPLGKTGTMFDFGVNSSGIIRLKLKNPDKGQKIIIHCGEFVNANGEFCIKNTGNFYPVGYHQAVYYIAKGDNEEIFEPSFTYSGFRYAWVEGLKEEQKTNETLTYLRANSDFTKIGGFECSDETMNRLGELSSVSDLANFWYFPTDCPHREKNGWTGDAAVSCEHILLTLNAEKSYKEWLRNICRSQKQNGELPGIIPTDTWGYEWGNGPAWDNSLSELCYRLYTMRGDLTAAAECSENLFRYLSYISQQRDEKGLVHIGLGDWLQPSHPAGDPDSPLYVTDSIICMYICKKTQILFEALGLKLQSEFAKSLYSEFREAIRNNCVDFDTMVVDGNCQTSQAIAIYYGVFEDNELSKAESVLIEQIHRDGDHINTGMIGGRVIFHVLSEIGESDLAFRMITRTDFPSYGMFITRGYTSLPEDFLNDTDAENPNSLNHHFFGDISSWFIQKIAGITPDQTTPDIHKADIKPHFISSLDYASAYYITESGKITSRWDRTETGYMLKISAPDEISGNIILPEGYAAENGATVLPLKNKEEILILKI